MDDNFDLFQMKLDNPLLVTIDSNSIFFEKATHLSKIETTCQPYKNYRSAICTMAVLRLGFMKMLADEQISDGVSWKTI